MKKRCFPITLNVLFIFTGLVESWLESVHRPKVRHRVMLVDSHSHKAVSVVRVASTIGLADVLPTRDVVVLPDA